MSREPAGRRARHWVTIQRPSTLAEGQAADGQPSGSWVKVTACYASVEPASGQERFRSHQTAGEISHVVKVPWLNVDIDSSMRLLLGTRTLNIKRATNVDEMDRDYLLECVEET